MGKRNVVEYNKGIFVSYRRDETTAYAGWLANRLADHFGQQNVFRDIGSIEPGMDFVAAIERALQSCAVMLVVIGSSWVTKLAEHEKTGQEDYARLEVTTALRRDDVRVIPLLVQRASMPRANELPADLAALTRRNAAELHDINWESDVSHLLSQLEYTVLKPVEKKGTVRVERQAKDGLGTITLFVDRKKIRDLASGEHIDLKLEAGAHRVAVKTPPPKQDPANPRWIRWAMKDRGKEKHITVLVYSGQVHKVLCGAVEGHFGDLFIKEE